MTSDDQTFAGVNGVEIHRRRWMPDGEPRARIVLAHGLSEHMGRYGHVAERFCAAGLALYALDHRGHGLSQGSRADIESMDAVVADLRTVVHAARADGPGRPVFLVGHSMGGAIALDFACRHQQELDGLILSSPAASLAAASWATRTLSKLLGALTPSLGVYAINSDGVSRDPEVVRDYDADPLNFHGRVPARTVAVLTRAIESFPDRVVDITLPLYVFHGGADPIVPPRATAMVHERVSSRDLTMHVFEGLYHECMNEPERDEVIARMVDWVEARL